MIHTSRSTENLNNYQIICKIYPRFSSNQKINRLLLHVILKRRLCFFLLRSNRRRCIYKIQEQGKETPNNYDDDASCQYYDGRRHHGPVVCDCGGSEHDPSTHDATRGRGLPRRCGSGSGGGPHTHNESPQDGMEFGVVNTMEQEAETEELEQYFRHLVPSSMASMPDAPTPSPSK